MPVIEMTRQQMDELTDKEDSTQRKIEKKYNPILWRFFKSVSSVFAAVYKDTGQIVSSKDFSVELSRIIEKQYAKTGDIFSDTFKQNLDKELVKVTKKGDEDREEIVAWWIESRKQAEKRIKEAVAIYAVIMGIIEADLILDTTDKIIRRVVNRIQEDALEDGVVLTRSQIAKKAKKEIDKLNKSRVPEISSNEVPDASEKAKQTEAQITNAQSEARSLDEGEISTIAILTQLIKTWITKGDEKVRPAHREADGQQQKILDPFIVGGELLMEPKDRSLGASIENVIKCRCKAIVT